MRIYRSPHFRQAQRDDDITDEEIVLVWTKPELDRPSQDYPQARVRTATSPDGTRVTVVARQTSEALEFITCWRH